MKRNENEQHLVSAILGGSTTSSISIAIICAALVGRSMRTSIEFLTNTSNIISASSNKALLCKSIWSEIILLLQQIVSSALTRSSVLWEFFES